MSEPPSKPSTELACAMYDELLALSRRALENGMLETAYHALAAALHAAEHAGDRERLRAIQDEATRQQKEVDTLASGHRLSRAGGRQHGHGGWYDALALQATSVLSRDRAAAALEKSIAERKVTQRFGVPDLNRPR